MKQLKKSASFSLVLCFLISTFIMLGTYNASAGLFPFNFSPTPNIGALVWQEIDNDGGDLGTGSPFSGVCQDSGTGLHIDDATAANGDSDAYDTAWLTTVNTTFVGTGDQTGPGDLTGNTFTQGPQNISGLDVTYQLYFSADTQCNRFVLFFDNNTGSPINETVRIATNFGSDENTQIEGTSSGDLNFTTDDRWLVTSDGGDSSDPVLTNVYYGPGSPAVTPNFVTSLVCGSSGPSPGAGATYDITVPQGSTRCLMLFGCLGDITGLQNTVEGALAAAPLFNSNNTIPGDLLSGLSDVQLTECVNWDFGDPPTVVSPIPTLSEWGLIALAGILGIVGFMVIRRRKATA